jgi:hypothetical protein
MSHIQNALKELREKRNRAQAEVENLNQIITGIESLNGFGVSHESVQPKRVISAASRRKMALAQKARWAGVRKASTRPLVVVKKSSTGSAKRTISAAGRKRIAAAQKARWGED